MKKMLFTLTISGTLLTSCMTTKTPVGNYLSQQGKEVTYDKGKQMWLFWGIIPIGRQHVNTPSSGDCQVVTKFRLSDVLISSLTGGLITSYSIKVEVKKGNEMSDQTTEPAKQ